MPVLLMVMNPLIQRALIALAAGTATSGALVVSAKKQGEGKRAKTRDKDGKVLRQPPEDAADRVARETKLLLDRGITLAEMRDTVAAQLKGLGSSVSAVFARAPAPTRAGAREPDEVDGVQNPSAQARSKKKRRRGRRRPQASLWDSAKESMRQTVKETVRDEVKGTPLGKVGEAAGGAYDVVKKAGASLRDGAQAAFQKARAALPPDAGAQWVASADQLGRSVALQVEAAAKSASQAMSEAAPHEGLSPDAAVEAARPSTERDSTERDSTLAASPSASSTLASTVNDGVTTLGNWLKGPGAPGYNRPKRVRANVDGDVVEAKDANDTKDAVLADDVAAKPEAD